MICAETGLMRDAGIWLFANGRPVAGFLIVAEPAKLPARFAAVGTDAVRVSACREIRLSSPPKINVRSFLIGAPMVPPKSLRLYPGIGPAGSKKFLASNAELRRNSKSVPCTALVPDFVVALTCPPPKMPYSAE